MSSEKANAGPSLNPHSLKQHAVKLCYLFPGHGPGKACGELMSVAPSGLETMRSLAEDLDRRYIVLSKVDVGVITVTLASVSPHALRYSFACIPST